MREGSTAGPALRASAPLRLSLAGGGTDLPEWYRAHGAHLVAVAIDLRIQVELGVQQQGTNGPLIDLARRRWGRSDLSVRCEVSAGAGLGGSGALAVALVALELAAAGRPTTDPLAIGLEAYAWERQILGAPVGFQDHLCAAFGSCVEMWAEADGRIRARRRSDLAGGMDELLSTSILLFDTSARRSASTSLGPLSTYLGSAPPDGLDGLAKVAEVEAVLTSRDGAAFGEVLRRHWAKKAALHPQLATVAATDLIDRCRVAGATGGKLVGAGGGGFVMVAGPADRRDAVVEAGRRAGVRPLPVKVADRGAFVDPEQAS
jgi:D-glycero-alpha-D-manno-heptose-7-phosphate kinase